MTKISKKPRPFPCAYPGCIVAYFREGHRENHYLTKHAEWYRVLCADREAEAVRIELERSNVSISAKEALEASRFNPDEVSMLLENLLPNESDYITTRKIDPTDFDSDHEEIDEEDIDEEGSETLHTLAAASETHPARSRSLSSRRGEVMTTDVLYYPFDVKVIREEPSSLGLPPGRSPYHPFRNAYEFSLAKFFIESNATKASIAKFFNSPLARTPPSSRDGKPGVCFTSPHTMAKMLDDMDPDMGFSSWKEGTTSYAESSKKPDFFYREIEMLLKHIFKQPYLEHSMIYLPIKELDRSTFDSTGEEYFMASDLHTTSWWWDEQVCTLAGANQVFGV